MGDGVFGQSTELPTGAGSVDPRIFPTNNIFTGIGKLAGGLVEAASKNKPSAQPIFDSYTNTVGTLKDQLSAGAISKTEYSVRESRAYQEASKRVSGVTGASDTLNTLRKEYETSVEIRGEQAVVVDKFGQVLGPVTPNTPDDMYEKRLMQQLGTFDTLAPTASKTISETVGLVQAKGANIDETTIMNVTQSLNQLPGALYSIAGRVSADVMNNTPENAEKIKAQAKLNVNSITSSAVSAFTHPTILDAIATGHLTPEQGIAMYDSYANDMYPVLADTGPVIGISDTEFRAGIKERREVLMNQYVQVAEAGTTNLDRSRKNLEAQNKIQDEIYKLDLTPEDRRIMSKGPVIEALAQLSQAHQTLVTLQLSPNLTGEQKKQYQGLTNNLMSSFTQGVGGLANSINTADTYIKNSRMTDTTSKGSVASKLHLLGQALEADPTAYESIMSELKVNETKFDRAIEEGFLDKQVYDQLKERLRFVKTIYEKNMKSQGLSPVDVQNSRREVQRLFNSKETTQLPMTGDTNAQ